MSQNNPSGPSNGQLTVQAVHQAEQVSYVTSNGEFLASLMAPSGQHEVAQHLM